MSQPSSAVYAAQLELHKKRAALLEKKQRTDGSSRVVVQTAVSQLPPHLGWGTATLSNLLRKKDHEQSNDYKPLVLEPVSPVTQSTPTPYATKIKHYPAIGLSAIQQKQVPHYQVWLSCRMLDDVGKGWVSVKEMRQLLTTAESERRLFGWRRLRQVLHQANGRLWTWDQHNGRLWLYSTAKVAQALHCAKLTGMPVYLPLNAFTQGIGKFKAHLYTAWHSGRPSNNPISRQTLNQLTAIPERTQRLYEKQTKTKVKANLAIGAAYTPENLEQQAWQRGGAVFKFLDKNGRFGSKQKTYLAWQLPNSYIGPHEQAAYGQQKQINHQLTDLVHKGAQGNGERKIERCYFDNGKDAAMVRQQKNETVTYWPEGEASSYSLWHLFLYA